MNGNAFIKLFKTPRGNYFFDVNKDTLVEISKDMYDYFNEKNEDVCVGTGVKAEIDLLKKQGFLSGYRTEIIQHPETLNLSFLLDNHMRHLVLQVTQACNLCCIYCPYAVNAEGKLQRKHSSKTLSFDMAKKVLDFFVKNSSETDNITIGFYGGEPLISVS